jgi:hypothetical protein
MVYSPLASGIEPFQPLEPLELIERLELLEHFERLEPFEQSPNQVLTHNLGLLRIFNCID